MNPFSCLSASGGCQHSLALGPSFAFNASSVAYSTSPSLSPLHFLPSILSLTHSVSIITSPSLSLTLNRLSSSYKDPCDDTGATWIPRRFSSSQYPNHICEVPYAIEGNIHRFQVLGCGLGHLWGNIVVSTRVIVSLSLLKNSHPKTLYPVK